MRLSDADRTDAINQLARAVGEGRLSMEEFEERSDDVMRATTRRELLPLFRDIPAPTTTEIKVYSQGEVERAYQASRKPRLAFTLTGSIALTFGSIAAFAASTSAGVGAALAGVGLLFLIPVLWIMAYLAKIGPASWYQPSPRQIERQKRRELQAATAHERAQMKALEQAQWAERRRQASEITGEAMNLAKRKLDQWNKK
ncbi:MAG: DUF1707 domain-containing protein [Corynebacterium sp.]|nr:DUF1707 domain-containing protein [Corynebacterium sp.]MDO5032774.1 DUF1707 domain-containing protein [Corynebacterium sp.]